MTELRLQEVLESTGGTLQGHGWRGTVIGHVQIDSRSVEPGDLFVALRGEREDGHSYVGHAFAAGAAAALVEREPPGYPWADGDARASPPLIRVRDTGSALQALAHHWRLRHNVEVVGVTGSVGKTTTKEVTASVLARRYQVLRTPGNLNTEIGVPLALLGLAPHHQFAVIEMGTFARGDISQLASIAVPRIGIVTNVQPSHLERLGSLEAIAGAKAELVEALPSDGLAILNADDSRVRDMARRASCETCTYGVAADAHVRASEVVSAGLGGISFFLHWLGKRSSIKLPMLGAHSVYSALAAAAVALRRGMTLFEVKSALEQADHSVRIAVVPAAGGAKLIDDTYNANPDSTLAALRLLSEFRGRKIAVLGDMLELGEYEEFGHRQVGAAAALVADLLIGVGPRSMITVEAARASGASGGAVLHCVSNVEAIEYLRRALCPGDNVLVKGSRGMHLEEIVQALRAESRDA